MKYVLWVSGLVLVLLIGYVAWTSLELNPTPPSAPVVEEPVLSSYASSTLGFSISYPKAFSLDERYAYDQFGEKKLIHGVKFTIPSEMATGTNLTSDSYISVEQLPRAKNCTGDIYLTANVRAETITENGRVYSLATSSGAAAGNLYEEFVYALSGSSPCTAIRYFIHSGNIGNYLPAEASAQAGEEGSVREFDRATLLAEFDKIRRSLSLTASNTGDAPTEAL